MGRREGRGGGERVGRGPERSLPPSPPLSANRWRRREGEGEGARPGQPPAKWRPRRRDGPAQDGGGRARGAGAGGGGRSQAPPLCRVGGASMVTSRSGARPFGFQVPRVGGAGLRP